MANTQRRTIPSPTDLQYAFLMENIHTYSLEDEIHRFSHSPQQQKQRLLKPQLEPKHPSLLPSDVDERVYTRAILPPGLRPSTNTPEYIPRVFPLFPPKYTYSYTPSYVPRTVDPEIIRRKAARERELVEQSLARLVRREDEQLAGGKGGLEGREGIGDVGDRGHREGVWWETWREMGCDLDGSSDVWPVPKMRRAVGAGM
jgi:hypothetical protein